MANTGKTVRLDPNDVPGPGGFLSNIINTFKRNVQSNLYDSEQPEILDTPKSAKAPKNLVTDPFNPKDKLRDLEPGEKTYVHYRHVVVDGKGQGWIDESVKRDDEWSPKLDMVDSLRVFKTGSGYVVHVVGKNVRWVKNYTFDPTNSDQYAPVYKFEQAVS